VAVITVNKFSGVSPMTPPRYLGNEAAQVALNCPVWLGSLQPIRGTSPIASVFSWDGVAGECSIDGVVDSSITSASDCIQKTAVWDSTSSECSINGVVDGTITSAAACVSNGVADPLTKSGSIKSIYRFDQSETDEDKNWFHWTDDVDVVQGFISGDTTERTYYTGDGVPKVTNNVLALTGGGTNYPVSSYTLGVPKPSGTFSTATTTTVLTGSIDPNPFGGTDSALTGSIDPTASVDVVGVSTLFTTELAVGNSIFVTGETRVVKTITDNTHLTVTVPFTDVANDATPMKASKQVLGVNTLFTTELAVGNSILVSGETRVVETITDNTHLTVTVPFTDVANDATPVITPNLSNTTAETRVYTFTYVNSWGEESAPYAETDMTASTEDVYPGQSVVVTMPTAPTGSYNVTKKRIYRSASGTTSTSYFFVAEVTVATTTYTDSISGDSLNEELPSLTWAHPPSDLVGLVGLPNGVMAGFKGNDVYFSEPYRPFAWPVQYMQTVGYPVVGLGVIDTTVVVLTKGRPYFIQGSHPSAMTMIEADVNQACISKRSIVSLNNVVFYASPDGLVGLSPGGSAVATQSMFDKYSWQALNPAGLVGCRNENQYVGFLNTTSGNGGFVYDVTAKTWNFHNIFATGGFNDLKNDALYVIKSNELWKWDTGSALSYTWKSKKFTFSEPKAFTCYRVQAEAYPVTIKIYREGSEVVNESILSDSVNRIPSGLGDYWEFQVEGSVEVYNIQLAQSPMELNQG
jgi:hypothetical protein